MRRGMAVFASDASTSIVLSTFGLSMMLLSFVGLSDASVLPTLTRPGQTVNRVRVRAHAPHARTPRTRNTTVTTPAIFWGNASIGEVVWPQQ